MSWWRKGRRFGCTHNGDKSEEDDRSKFGGGGVLGIVTKEGRRGDKMRPVVSNGTHMKKMMVVDVTEVVDVMEAMEHWSSFRRHSPQFEYN